MSRHRTSRGDAPLLAWGDALRGERQAKARRRRRLMQSGGALAILCALLATTIVVAPTPRLVWNSSRSAPLGLYLVSPGQPVRRGDFAVAHMPEEWRWLAAERGYLPERVPLVKRVAAVSGQTVCAAANRIIIDGRQVAERRAVDSRHRPMPWWNGCRILGQRQVFLLMAEHPQSFDGRYFGVTESTEIIGQVQHVRLRSAWRGPAR
ncbi:S26 family signal peptidase [Novosphingobium resinovorum]|uniref:Peptidase S26 domain-containing protein n=1 Tax=Novosphingobium resinovorum TaxID=158500 RepID=A0A1D8A2M0_9SPHN|nr:S26 family signal peptidase [Novosphingobium resinovorum]AOR76375.1 hypothetical protein BES08_06120 [Novosphingobium resinovorum]